MTTLEKVLTAICLGMCIAQVASVVLFRQKLQSRSEAETVKIRNAVKNLDSRVESIREDVLDNERKTREVVAGAVRSMSDDIVISALESLLREYRKSGR